MFNLLVSGSGWAAGRDTMPSDRAFEYTAADLTARFKPSGVLAVQELLALPTVFVEESGRNHDPVAHVGTITRIGVSGRELSLTYAYDAEIPGLLNSRLKDLRSQLGIEEFEFTRTHWAVKNADLYYTLLVNQQPRRSRPRVFNLVDPEAIEPELMSAMMPFDPRFDAVYAALSDA